MSIICIHLFLCSLLDCQFFPQPPYSPCLSSFSTIISLSGLKIFSLIVCEHIMLKVHRFGVTCMASVFACERVPWPEAAFLSSAGFFAYVEGLWSTASRDSYAPDARHWHFMAVTQSQLGPQKLSSVCEEKNERGNGTKKLVITLGVSNISP